LLSRIDWFLLCLLVPRLWLFAILVVAAVAWTSSFVAILDACLTGLLHNTSYIDQYNQSELYSLRAENTNC
jgi:hypothetical protein